MKILNPLPGREIGGHPYIITSTVGKYPLVDGCRQVVYTKGEAKVVPKRSYTPKHDDGAPVLLEITEMWSGQVCVDMPVDRRGGFLWMVYLWLDGFLISVYRVLHCVPVKRSNVCTGL